MGRFGLSEKAKCTGVYLVMFSSMGWGYHWIARVGTCWGEEELDIWMRWERSRDWICVARCLGDEKLL